MPQKAQHARPYRVVPPFLRQLREEAELTQRALGDLLGKPQSWAHDCETGNRRVDVTEFIEWCRACGAKPTVAVARLAGEDRR